MMAKTNTTRLSLAKRLAERIRHSRYLAALAAVSVLLVANVALMVSQHAATMVAPHTVLDCHYRGNGAHTHNADCYDEGGNLVCPLEVRELHTHTDACYAEERVLVCGLEEGPDHTHTDACYEVERVLVCGKEEITEEHVHGPGCFRTVGGADDAAADSAASDDAATNAREAESGELGDLVLAIPLTDDPADEVPEGEAVHHLITADDSPAVGDEDADTQDAVTSDADAGMPAQVFEQNLTKTGANGREEVVLSVLVRAPEGAFPAGTTMKVTPVAKGDVDGKVADALKREGSDAKIKQVTAVDISFFDAEGNEIEPQAAIDVKITSDAVRDNEGSMLVHVDDKGGTAEVVRDTARVNRNDDDTSTGHEDTLQFTTDRL